MLCAVDLYRIQETATIVLDQVLTFRLCKLSISWLQLHYETVVTLGKQKQRWLLHLVAALKLAYLFNVTVIIKRKIALCVTRYNFESLI